MHPPGRYVTASAARVCCAVLGADFPGDVPGYGQRQPSAAARVELLIDIRMLARIKDWWHRLQVERQGRKRIHDRTRRRAPGEGVPPVLRGRGERQTVRSISERNTFRHRSHSGSTLSYSKRDPVLGVTRQLQRPIYGFVLGRGRGVRGSGDEQQRRRQSVSRSLWIAPDRTPGLTFPGTDILSAAANVNV